MGLKMLLGIILHPFKRIYELSYRQAENEHLAYRARGIENYKNWERMHDMSEVTGTAFTESELYDQINGGGMIAY